MSPGWLRLAVAVVSEAGPKPVPWLLHACRANYRCVFAGVKSFCGEFSLHSPDEYGPVASVCIGAFARVLPYSAGDSLLSNASGSPDRIDFLSDIGQ